jgi:hypothetical protein
MDGTRKYHPSEVTQSPQFFFFPFFIRYLAHLHFQCYTKSPPYPPPPPPPPPPPFWPWHSPVLGLLLFFIGSRVANTYKCIANVCILWGEISQRMCPFFIWEILPYFSTLSCLPPLFLNEDSTRSMHLISLRVLMVQLYCPKIQRLILKTDTCLQRVKCSL